jgi:AraC family transcriptional regulator
MHQKGTVVKAQRRQTDLEVLINPPASLLGVKNAVLTGRARQYHTPEFLGPLSIKTVARGSARWQTTEADRLVDTCNYLILNAGHPYTLTIDTRETTETFCLFFRRGLVEDASRVYGSEPAALLDNPADPDQPSTQEEFFETLHAHDSVLSPLLQTMHSRLANNQATAPWLEDQFMAVAAGLVKLHGEANRRVAKISAKKPGTRLELYRRLLRGRDYMDSFFSAHVRLSEVARQACLSPYHFHRRFREVFRETPNQYLQRKRLEHAGRLLERDNFSVTDVCLETGFESVTSFSGLFRRSFGCSPREYRQRKNSKC